MAKKSPADLKKEGKELGAVVAALRKKTHNFAMLIGKEGIVLETDLRKPPATLRKMAKSAGGGPKGAMGQMRCKGKIIQLTVEDDEVPDMVLKAAKKHFQERGQGYRFEVMETIVEEDDEAEEEAAAEEDKSRKKKQEAEAPEQERQGASDATSSRPGGAGAPKKKEDAPAEEAAAPAQPQEASEEEEETVQAAVEPNAQGPIKIGKEPEKAELAGDFTDMRKDLLKSMGQMTKEAQETAKESIKKFGEMMKSKDFKGAQDLMDDMSILQGNVSEKQRGRARNEVAEIDTVVGGVETSLKDIKSLLEKQGAAQ